MKLAKTRLTSEIQRNEMAGHSEWIHRLRTTNAVIIICAAVRHL